MPFGSRPPPRRRSNSRSRFRLAWLSVILTLAFAAMGSRLFVVQIMNASAYAKLAEDQRVRTIEFPARRGAIFDRSGEPLAISVDLKTIYADPALVEDPRPEAEQLAPLLHLDVAELEEKLRGRAEGSRFEYLARQVKPKVAAKVRALDLPGIYMLSEAKRYYPGGSLAAHVLGLTDTDGNGIAGIESEYDSILEGRPGHQTLEQDPSGRVLPQAASSYVEPVPGRSLFLTIDKEIQYFTELALAQAAKEYNAAGASAIVMRPATGEILALANVPDFDPNKGGDATAEQLRNRAITDVYEPGSAFKVVALSAAIEEGVVTPETTYTVPDSFPYYDRVFNDSHPHETLAMTVREIMEQSSNVGTIKIALDLGATRLSDYVDRFGFGSRTGLDFPGESSGIVLPLDMWSGTTLATVPMGQGVAVTPLQLISFYGALANNGVWVEPKLLAASLTGAGTMQMSPEPAARRLMAETTAANVVSILTGVVEKGTGIEAQIPGYRVAGKTGTAQKPADTGGYGNDYVASFAGFAPAQDPQIVAIVVLDDPDPIWGGSTAAPTFRRIVEFALRHLGVAPTGDAVKAAQEIEAEQAVMPSTLD